MARMRFGIFMAPFHAPTGQNPTAAYARDVATIQLLDELGYDEAWIGEHHSGGVEIIPSPEIFIAHVRPPRHPATGRGRGIARRPRPQAATAPAMPSQQRSFFDSPAVA